MARRKPGRGGGEGEGGVGPRSRGSVGAQRNASARPVAVTVRSPGRVSAPPFNPRAGGGNNNSQQPAANAAAAAAASQRERARSLRPEKESPPPPPPPPSRPPPQPSRPLAPRRPSPPRPSVPGARRRGRLGGEGGSRLLLPPLPPRRRGGPRHCPAEGRRGEGERYVFISGRAGSGRRCRSGRGGVGGKAAGWRLKGAFSARCGRPERGGIRRTGRRGRGGAAAIRGGGGGEAGSYRVSVSQKWEASEAQVPPGSAAPLGRRAEEVRPSPPAPPAAAPPSPVAKPLPGAGLRRPRAPSEPVRGLGALRLWHLRERWQEEECCQREDKRGMAMPATYG